MQRVRDGDHAAYGVLVRRYGPIAVRTATMLGAGGDAEDVVQEAFVKAYRAFGRLRPGAAFRPWLLAIVANETRNVQRAGYRRTDRERRSDQQQRPIIDPRSTGAGDPADAVIDTERRSALLAGLERLSANHREVLVCRYLLQLDESETADVLGLSKGTVKSRASRALRSLQTELTAAEVPTLPSENPEVRRDRS